MTSHLLRQTNNMFESTNQYNIRGYIIFAHRSQHGQTPIKWLMVNVDIKHPHQVAIIDGYFSPFFRKPVPKSSNILNENSVL